MKASLVHPDPPLVANTPTHSLTRLYQKSQTTFESKRAAGDRQTARGQRGRAGAQVQHWEQRLLGPGASIQTPPATKAGPLPMVLGLNKGILRAPNEGTWEEPKYALSKDGRGGQTD